MIENEITQKIIGCAIEVHRELGPGLLESAYEECLFYVLNQNQIYTERQKAMPLLFKGVHLDCGYRLDLFIERKVIVELKAVEAINDVHKAQLMTYMKLAKCKVGLLINFNVVRLKDGIVRWII
ncbi:GxxExxY protein [Runella aurantiaca]|uniref:GxxExxY protein n=1 Tax=Runella aurantiaca TaxID=2282308 RepID=A0A369I490_9BACT|nr:GxxExxY protein [Runella aurantiaca]RDB03862.1 GxxExxY protein [Runella aurantiaca]